MRPLVGRVERAPATLAMGAICAPSSNVLRVAVQLVKTDARFRPAASFKRARGLALSFLSE